MKRPGGPTCFLAVILGCLSAGLSSCADGDGKTGLYQELQSKDPNERIAAIIKAADAKDAKAVPLIVENLGSEESDVRLYAYVALEKLTGKTMGYIYYAPRASRERAIEQWRAWLRAGRPENFTPATAPDDRVPAATSPAATTSSAPATSPAAAKAQP